MTARGAVALALLLAMGLGLVWFAKETPAPAGQAPAKHAVYVVGPTSLLHAGNITMDSVTALAALQQLAQEQDFAVVADDLPGCSYDYVRGVAGFTESSTGGWNYYVASPAGWQWQDEAASCKTLAPGDAVLWCWVEPDERCAVYP